MREEEEEGGEREGGGGGVEGEREREQSRPNLRERE